MAIPFMHQADNDQASTTQQKLKQLQFQTLTNHILQLIRNKILLKNRLLSQEDLLMKFYDLDNLDERC
jgi:hypothetical protein